MILGKMRFAGSMLDMKESLRTTANVRVCVTRYRDCLSLGGGELPGPGPMPGPMDSMCCSIRSMCPTIVSHVSTFVCQRAFSSLSFILAVFAFICSSVDFIFDVGFGRVHLFLVHLHHLLLMSAAVWRLPVDEAGGVCVCVSWAHATETNANVRISKTGQPGRTMARWMQMTSRAGSRSSKA